jgi:hypothetical protein
MSMISQSPLPAALLIDSHVHFHACFDRDAFFDAALRNFSQGAAELGIAGPFLGCLMLAEAAGVRWFLRWSRGEDGAGSGAWSCEPTADPAALVARRRADGERLLVIAGRQVRSREGLEVLALATREEFPDGLPFHDALARVRWSGALTVLPWGFGKWWLYRGALVEAVVCRAERPGICLGDNAGRWEFADPPRLFREAEARGIPVLPGSDPLPLPEHLGRAGRYGFHLAAELDPRQLATSLRRTLRSLAASPPAFGRRRELAALCRDQLALRLRPRRTAPAARPGSRETERLPAPSAWRP